jgi:hypothetical protein
MEKNFSFQSNIKDIQNSLISQNIRTSSNLDILTSEEAIRNVIKSYTDKFQAIGGVLIDINKYVVNSKDIIKVKDFNDLFEGIYIDLYALYSDLGLVAKVLDLNLQRNKNYFLAIKKRIKDLWNKLNLTRTYIYDSNPSDESYYESFFTDINSSYIRDLIVDKKSGYLYLNPLKTDIQNKSYQIKNITSVTYPEPSDTGGVFKTTDILNTFEDNYVDGPRDMMQNGLWKEEYMTNDLPSMIINIGSNESPINRNYKGIVSIIDIEYSNLIEFNRLDLDLFGDKPTLIDAVLYKERVDQAWKVLNFLPEDPLLSEQEIDDSTKYSVRGEGFDVISFYNIEKAKARYIRLVVNQENYSLLDSKSNQTVSIEDKVNKDLSERRYELVKFGSTIDGFLSSPVNSSNKSLYDKIMDIIETTSSIENILKGIEELLLPETNVVKVDFSDTYKFEIGLWSIDPKLEVYTHSKGVFNSNPYRINDRALISSSITTRQETPSGTSCNWYIDIDGKSIPVIENNKIYRKEPIVPISMSAYPNYSGWSSGCFILLDFPLEVLREDEISIYTNGKFQPSINNSISFLNSRLLYLHGIYDPYYANYTIRYPSSLYKTVNLYSLSPKTVIEGDYSLIQFGIVSSRKEILESFISNIRYYKTNPTDTDRYISDDFTVVNALATIEEASDWFGTAFDKSIFISRSIISLLDTSTPDYGRFSSTIKEGESKLVSQYSDALDHYINRTNTGFSNLSVLSSFSNLAPLSNVREL